MENGRTGENSPLRTLPRRISSSNPWDGPGQFLPLNKNRNKPSQRDKDLNLNLPELTFFNTQLAAQGRIATATKG